MTADIDEFSELMSELYYIFRTLFYGNVPDISEVKQNCFPSHLVGDGGVKYQPVQKLLIGVSDNDDIALLSRLLNCWPHLTGKLTKDKVQSQLAASITTITALVISSSLIATTVLIASFASYLRKPGTLLLCYLAILINIQLLID